MDNVVFLHPFTIDMGWEFCWDNVLVQSQALGKSKNSNIVGDVVTVVVWMSLEFGQTNFLLSGFVLFDVMGTGNGRDD